MPSPIDGYLAKQPPAARRVLRAVRAALKKGLPRAEEVISYAIPALRSEGRVVLFFAGWKDHYAVYPVGELVRRELASEIAPYDHAKGTLRFSFDEPVPADLLGRIAALRALEVASLAAARKNAPKKAAKKKAAKKATKKTTQRPAKKRPG